MGLSITVSALFTYTRSDPYRPELLNLDKLVKLGNVMNFRFFHVACSTDFGYIRCPCMTIVLN
jgi:hypothetical protein